MKLKDAIDENGGERGGFVQIDLKGLTSMDATGFSALSDVAKAAVEKGQEVVFISPNDRISRALDKIDNAKVISCQRKTNKIRDKKFPAKKLPIEPLDAVDFEFPNHPRILHNLRNQVVEYAQKMPFTVDDLDDIRLAVGEAGANAIRHGSNPDWSKIAVRIERYDDAIKIFVADKGLGFNPDDIAPVEEDSLADSGRGIMFMKAVMDEVVIHSNKNGTVVELTKRTRDDMINNS